ncbi:type VI secretion system protein ImpK [Thalassolituus maritimus]|jgi:type VI secretion system protein ImpK|uniref:Type VI secretion system protein ImpK n=1 Tax=Thalassolituus maritimus TaxID=484498 RepID=A0A1N7P4V2_9GAMM|nr:type IVB secretion system protein IcmH/DotU [Thalassolituus maritimus]SIT05588.1 type VI secretion system protein ImpK [Thalassolituus maritimus]
MGNDGQQPGASDRTVMIPTPGAARSSSGAGQGRATSPQPAMPGNEKIDVRHGLNPLVTGATTLLTLVTKLRSTMKHDQVPDLHKRLTEEIKSFERNARNAGITGDTVVAARYLLCSVIDEMVLNTPWGASSGWSQHSLLSLFHQETSGGEKSFLILQKLLETPGTHLDLLELYYLCLSLGFQGKYRVMPRGNEQLEQIRENLYHTIESHRPGWESELSPHWEGSVKPSEYLKNYIPLWVIASVVMALLVLTYSGFRYWMYQETTPVAESIYTEITGIDGTPANNSEVVSPPQGKRFY